MTGRIAIFSPGLMRLSSEIRILTGLEPHFAAFSARGSSAIAGWGHKPTADRARNMATKYGLPYMAFEDGFLRALKPGSHQRPVSLVMDRSGIYYDARQPSDLESMLQTAAFSAAELAEARTVMTAIAAHGLSKYNHGLEELDGVTIDEDKPLVVVIDQTAGDASISGGLADASSFNLMVEAAASENPGATLIAKLHPETLLGTKQGHIQAAASRAGMQLLTRHVSPWSLLRRKPHVYTVSSQFGFEALMAGCRVTCFGVPFYAGWGLTDDRTPAQRRTALRSLEELAAAVYLRYCRYFDVWRRTASDALTAIEQLAFLRKTFLSNNRPVIGYRIARWKRGAVTTMLDGPHGPPRFTRSLKKAEAEAKRTGASIAAWGEQAIQLRPRLEAKEIGCLAVEDGFLRSVGLGAAFVQPMSLVFDSRGLYFDPSRPSDIEHLLAEAELSPQAIAMAGKLREDINAARITKYNVKTAPATLPRIPEGQRAVLVPGQVADDAAVIRGRVDGFPANENINAVLLERVRARNPGAFVIFKPHPDVEHLGRAGALGNDGRIANADQVVRDTSLDALFAIVTRVETYSSLSGFEALLRGIPVTTHGIPFFAGWGLTEDCARIMRRGRKRSLDELVALTLMCYARYWDPASRLPCPPDVTIERITAARSEPARPLAGIGVMLGRGVIAARRLRRLILRVRT